MAQRNECILRFARVVKIDASRDVGPSCAVPHSTVMSPSKFHRPRVLRVREHEIQSDINANSMNVRKRERKKKKQGNEFATAANDNAR